MADRNQRNRANGHLLGLTLVIVVTLISACTLALAGVFTPPGWGTP